MKRPICSQLIREPNEVLPTPLWFRSGIHHPHASVFVHPWKKEGLLPMMEKASLQISEFLVKCKKSKVSPWDLKPCTSLLQRENYLRKDKLILMVVVLGSLFYLASYFVPHSTQCSVGLPDTVRKAFRPPISCEFCRSVTNVQKVKRISREEFEERFAYSAIPVIVGDATTNWTALSTFNYWYFKETYNRAKQKQKTLICQFFPYKSGFRNLYDALENPPEHFNLEKKAWYFGWSNCNPEIAEELRQHYGRPYFLPEVSENNAVDWIFMGMSGLGAHMHVDNVRLPSWQAQLSGSKKWVLMPPPECYFVCSQVEATVDEGDIIVLDTNKWYHQTIVLPGRISITIGAEYD